MADPHLARLTFEQAVGVINALEKRGWRLGLDRMEEFLRRLALSGTVSGPNAPKYVHVAGTNGKGSTTAYVESILVEQGHATGSFYSPYVYDIRERIQFNRKKISQRDFARLVGQLITEANLLADTEFGGATEFEFKTAMGLAYWREREAQWVALEVGLGGRLDATNVVEPAASVITSIGLDHIHILGNTYSEIAFEKAGILKPGKPAIIGKMPAEALDSVLRVAAERECPVWRYGEEIHLHVQNGSYLVETPVGAFDDLVPGITGSMQSHNMALAIAAVGAAGGIKRGGQIAEGVRKARVPGRFEEENHEGRRFILDGAHNSEAVDVLIRSLFEEDCPAAKRLYIEDPDLYVEAFEAWEHDHEGTPRIILITGMMAGHEPESFYGPLAKLAKSAHISQVAQERAWDAGDIVAKAGHLFRRCVAHETFEQALASAIMESEANDLILVTGSFYVVGEVGNLMGRQ